MSDQVLKDNSGRTIGRIVASSNGVLTLKDPQGRTKGTYDPRTNKTKDPAGRSIGTGNLLVTLL